MSVRKPPPDAPVLSVRVEQGTFSLMNDIIMEALGEERRAAYLSGPSFAEKSWMALQLLSDS